MSYLLADKPARRYLRRYGVEPIFRGHSEAWEATTRMTVTLPPDYVPSEKEPFMNPLQQEYFRQKLLRWKAELLDESLETRVSLKETSFLEPDLADRASAETDRS